MERTRSAQARTEGDSGDGPRDPARLEVLIEALLASVRGGDGVDPTLPGPVSCSCSGSCFHEPCESPPKESLQLDLVVPSAR